MLRINLLPSYVAQRRLNKKLIVSFVVLFSAVVVCMLLFELLYLVPTDLHEKMEAQQATDATTLVTGLQQQAATITAGVAPIQSKIDFVHQVATYNEQYPILYKNVAKYTSPRILYIGMSVTGSTLTISAYTPSIEDLGRYLQYMYHEPDFSTVSISALPTSDAAAQKIYFYRGVRIGQSGGTLVQSAGGTTTTTNLPGIPPGVTVTLPAGVKLPAASKTGQANGGLPSPTPNAQGAGGLSGTPLSVYATILSDPYFDPKFFKVVVRKTDGFTFTATCTLKTALTLPAVPTPGAAATAGGPPGGPPGAPPPPGSS